MGALSFNAIPVNLLTPGSYTEFDNSRAVGGLSGMPQRILIIAPKLAAGTATGNVPFQVNRLADAITLLGQGSIAADVLAGVFAVTDTIEIWALPVADAGGGTAATGTITIAGTPTAAATLALYIAGNQLQISVATTDTATTIAAAIVAAINGNADLPVTAANASGVVTVTARNKGTLGNDIDMRANYYPLSETTPPGITVAFAAMTGGAGDPSIATALANLGDTQYNTVIMAFNDASNIALLETELDKRWGPLYQNDSHAHIGLRGTVGTINTALSSRNNPHTTFWTAETGGEPTPVWRKAAEAGATCAYYFGIDPARPVQTLALPTVLPASAEKRFTRAERNNVLSYGGATTKVDAAGKVSIERAVTAYTLNTAGTVDPSYRDAETMYTLSYLRYSLRAWLASHYPRYKLVGDTEVIPAGSPMINPRGIRLSLIALFMLWQEAGLVEDIEQFKADLVVQLSSDPNTVDVILPPNLVNQLRIFRSQIQFRL